MSNVELGYEIDRALVIAATSILFLLFVIQATSEFFSGWTNTRYSVRWTAHRLGPLGSLFAIARAVDARQAFHVFTDQTKLSSWFAMSQITCMYIMSFAIVYSVIVSNARTARYKVSPKFSHGLFAMSVMTPFIMLSIMIAAYVRDEHAREYLFDLWCGIAGCIVWVLFMYYGWSLRQTLQANLNNPQLTKLAKKGFVKMNRAIIVTCLILGAINIYQLETASDAWGQVDSRTGDPKMFRLVYIATDVLLTAGLTLLLWLTWIPIKFTCKTGPFHLPYTFLRLSDNSDHTGGSSNTAGTGSGAKNANNTRKGSVPLTVATPTAGAGSRNDMSRQRDSVGSNAGSGGSTTPVGSGSSKSKANLAMLTININENRSQGLESSSTTQTPRSTSGFAVPSASSVVNSSGGTEVPIITHHTSLPDLLRSSSEKSTPVNTIPEDDHESLFASPAAGLRTIHILTPNVQPSFGSPLTSDTSNQNTAPATTSINQINTTLTINPSTNILETSTTIPTCPTPLLSPPSESSIVHMHENIPSLLSESIEQVFSPTSVTLHSSHHVVAINPSSSSTTSTGVSSLIVNPMANVGSKVWS